MNKILVIGQAPPAVSQLVPYDTTLLYEMLSWVEINKEQAQDMFEWEAMTDKFPGFNKDTNGHTKPSEQDMINYWNNTLKEKAIRAKKILLLGSVSRDFFNKYIDCKIIAKNRNVVSIIHPSRRNYDRIIKSKDSITNLLKDFLS